MSSSNRDNNTWFQSKFYIEKDDSAFRTQNEPGEIQRAHIIDDDTSQLLVQADLDTVIHGWDSNIQATLIVITFRFLGAGPKERFRRVQALIRFQDKKKRVTRDPEVVGLWPQGDYTLSESEGTAEETTSTGASISPGFGGSSASLTWVRDRHNTHRKKDRAYLVGVKRIEGRNCGKKNAVRLSIFEDETQESGVVTELRSVILLHRSTDERFLAYITVDATANLKYTVEKIKQRVLRTSPVVDPVVFDPRSSAINRLKRTVDQNDLASALVGLGKALSTVHLTADGTEQDLEQSQQSPEKETKEQEPPAQNK
ncbi:hypothetical protein GGR51DRAFT_507579 [Nemania sp. FL0031]|nr:hypothetical protein GGR51DRAFT_507579 [Nemania sp. FL0031]